MPGKDDAIHYPDREFDQVLKKYFSGGAGDLISKLKEEDLVISLIEDPVEALFYKYRLPLRQFLVREKEYKYNGTGVWLQLPDENDVKEFIEKVKNDEL